MHVALDRTRDVQRNVMEGEGLEEGFVFDSKRENSVGVRVRVRVGVRVRAVVRVRVRTRMRIRIRVRVSVRIRGKGREVAPSTTVRSPYSSSS